MARLGGGNPNLPAIPPSGVALRLAILDPLALRPGPGTGHWNQPPWESQIKKVPTPVPAAKYPRARRRAGPIRREIHPGTTCTPAGAATDERRRYGHLIMLQVIIEQDRVRIGERFAVSFQRTLRIPDDGRTYPLPPGLGRFPIHRVDEVAAGLPESWRPGSDPPDPPA